MDIIVLYWMLLWMIIFLLKFIIMFNKYSYISFEEKRNNWFLKSFYDWKFRWGWKNWYNYLYGRDDK